MLKETHLKMEEKLLDIGWKTGSTHIFGTSVFDGAAFTRTFTMVYKLRVASKCHCNCSFAKCQVPRCASANGTIPNVD